VANHYKLLALYEWREFAAAGERHNLIAPTGSGMDQGPAAVRRGSRAMATNAASERSIDVLLRNPTTGIAVCCACAASGHAGSRAAVNNFRISWQSTPEQLSLR
jgi:hypothetical protein